MDKIGFKKSYGRVSVWELIMDKKILVTRSSMPPMEEYIDEIKSLWNNCWLTNMGEKHRELQRRLIEYLGVQYIELLTNGHMALELGIQALGMKKGEIITTPFTFASTTHAIVRNGMTPVFCDIDPITYTIDVTKIEALITDKTVAILPVHVYGNICDVKRIDEIAKEYNLKVIYDAAHAFGQAYEGKGIGNYGDISCFSFHATKVFHTIEGGAVSFSDEEYGRRLYGLKNFGIRNEDTVDGVGANAKMNEFCAAMGLCNLRYIDAEIDKRKKVAERYRMHLEKVRGIRLNIVQANVKSNYSYFPILIDEMEFGCNRNELREKLAENNIGCRKYFYPLTSTFQCFAEQFDVSKTPMALGISEKVLTLPLYAELSLEEVDKICNVIIETSR